jgi:hypothetical protein
VSAPVQPLTAVDEPSEILEAAGEIVIDEQTGLKAKDLIGRHITKKFYGEIYNGTVNSYRHKPKNKCPIVYWVFFDEFLFVYWVFFDLNSAGTVNNKQKIPPAARLQLPQLRLGHFSKTLQSPVFFPQVYHPHSSQLTSNYSKTLS